MTVVGLVPAYDSERSVAACVSALRTYVDEVLVIDDGSQDRTATEAVAAGAAVLRLDRNLGKGAAVAAGVAARPAADFYLLADADLGETASGLRALLGPVVSGAADMTIGVLPSAGRRGGFGITREFAGWGIERATGWAPQAPISGQRAIRGPLLRALLASAATPDRFGLEPFLSIDALRNGARLLEMPVMVDHHHRGRTASGFVHRAGQAVDIARALWPRLTSQRVRVAALALAFVAAVVLSHAIAVARQPGSTPLLSGASAPSRVLLLGMPGVQVDDLESMPNLADLAKDGAVGALTVRTRTGSPTSVEGYATVGAGNRVDAERSAAAAFNANERVEGGAAGHALARRSGTTSSGEVVVVGAAAAARQAGDRVATLPGALGEALHRAGLSTAVVGNADTRLPGSGIEPQLGTGAAEPTDAYVHRPAAVAVMDQGGSVDFGRVDPGLLVVDPAAPFGIRADPEKVIAALSDSVGRGADVLIVDPGDLDRALAFAESASEVQAKRQRTAALRRFDALIPALVRAAGPDAMVIAFGVTPPAGGWHLTPLVVHGRSIRAGSLVHSALTHRPGIASITDIAPTALGALGAPHPQGMSGSPLRTAVVSGSTHGHIDRLERIDRIAAYREQIYVPSTAAYILFQGAVYLLALFVFSRAGGRSRLAAWLRLAVLVVAAYPLATFLHRAVPGVERWGALGIALLPILTLATAWLCLRLGRGKPLAPLGWIAGLTIAVLAVDVSFGANLQSSSLLGYSFHAPGRFTGFGNQTFAILVATTILAGALHVHHAPRRGEAVLSVGLLFLFVTILDGSPSLGSDVGGILTMVPVFGLTWLALAGRRISWRAAVAAGAITLLALGAAAAIDVARPPESRTHLGRLVADVGNHGAGPLIETVGRKASMNLNSWESPWVWGLALLALSALTVLLVGRNWRMVFPDPPALRVGFIGTIAAGLLGYAVNDSGAVIAALTLVYLGPFLTLVALAREGTPVELTAGPAGPRAVALVT